LWKWQKCNIALFANWMAIWGGLLRIILNIILLCACYMIPFSWQDKKGNLLPGSVVVGALAPYNHGVLLAGATPGGFDFDVGPCATR
jgi:hypothetical protein